MGCVQELLGGCLCVISCTLQLRAMTKAAADAGPSHVPTLEELGIVGVNEVGGVTRIWVLLQGPFGVL